MAEENVTDENPAEPVAEDPQHPADPAEEVAARTADTDQAKAKKHRKVFVLPTVAYDGHGKEAAKQLHDRNLTATRQEMVSKGLRPTGTGRFVKAEEHGDGASTDLIYEVPAEPAVRAAGDKPVVIPVDADA